MRKTNPSIAPMMAAAAALAWSTAVPAAPVGSGLTFQGQLKQNGQPYNGSASLVFTLWDSAGAGNPPVGGVQIGGPDSNPAVQVTNGLFTVVINDAAEFGASAFAGDARWVQIMVNGTVVGPRQLASAAPYALYALSGPGVGGFWAGSGTNINNTNAGNVGIGTSSPTARLDVASPSNSAVSRIRAGNLAQDTWLQLWSGHSNGSNDPAIIWSDGAAGDDLRIGPGNADGSAFVEVMRITGAGDVGIGTATPETPLHILGGTDTALASGGYVTIGATTGTNISIDNNEIMCRSNGNPTTLALNAEGGNVSFMQAGAGRIGIHTTTPDATIDIVNDMAATEPNLRALRYSTATLYNYLDIRGAAIDSEGNGFFGDPLILNGSTAQNIFLATGGGNVGVNCEVPLAKLEVEGTDLGMGLGPIFEDDLVVEDSDAMIGLYSSTGGTNASGISLGEVSGGNLVDKWTIVRGTNATGGQLRFRYGTDANYANNATKMTLTTGGTLSVNVLQILGADLAEKFPTSDHKDDVLPGTVMEIDPHHAGMLRIAGGAYNRRVAGVVSGANGLAAGTIMGNLPGHEDAPPVALSGRVWVRCEASQCAIDIGDMLTTSDCPGHAMKAVDLGRSHGAVIGKAMTALAHGDTGLVLVLVNLQ